MSIFVVEQLYEGGWGLKSAWATRKYAERDLADLIERLDQTGFRIREYTPSDDVAARVEAVEAERDKAIAHDRQPYPTSWAYEQLAKAHEKLQRRVKATENAAARYWMGEATTEDNILLNSLAGEYRKRAALAASHPVEEPKCPQCGEPDCEHGIS